jgi:hypothetical protein
MLVSVEKNFVFVHVAKTGGQAQWKSTAAHGVAGTSFRS